MAIISETKPPTHDEIAKFAFTLYEERGREDGHDVEDWLAAVAHVSTDTSHSRPNSSQERRKTP